MTLIPPSFSFKGDRQKSISLKAQARQFYNFIVNQAELGGIPFINRSLVLSDGSVISVVSKKESIYGHRTGTIFINTSPTIIERLVAEGLYMESGFLQLGMTATCNELTFLPATLHYNDSIQAYTSSPLPLEGKAAIDENKESIDAPYYGEALIEGYTSKTLVGTLDATVTDLCGNIYTSDEKIYGNQTTWQCKYAQRYVPASLYSGKLRLYVQAVYGSTSQDYSVVPLTLNPDAKTYDLILKGYRLNQGIATSGIFTTSTYDYYMMECNVNSVTFKKLKISTVAQGWIDILKTHSNRTDREFSSKVEAYVLSTAIIDPEFIPVVSTTGLSVSEGTPYAYGFHFNWAGNQAKVVWHRSVGDGTYRARTITLDIADDLTVVGSESSEQAWSNSQYLQFWYPDMYDGSMKTAGTVPTSSINSSGCPMYGYYDYFDMWQQFEILVALENSDPDSDSGPLTQAHLDGNFGGDAIDYARYTIAGSTQLHGAIGYRFGGVDHTYPVLSSVTKNSFESPIMGNMQSHYNGFSSTNNVGPVLRSGEYLMNYMVSNYPSVGEARGWIYRPLGFPKWIFDYQTYSPPLPGNYSYRPVDPNAFGIGVTTVQLSDWLRLNGYSDLAEIMFSVPFGDCESMVYGVFNGASWTSKNYGSASLPGVLRKPQISLEYVYSNSSGSIIPQSSWIEVDIPQVLNIAGLTPSLVQTGTEGPGAATQTEIILTSSGVSGWTHNVSDGYVVNTSSGTDVSPPTDWAEKYFRVTGPGPGYEAYHPTMIARSSANGAHILYHDEGTGKNENGFPDGVYSSTGWS